MGGSYDLEVAGYGLLYGLPGAAIGGFFGGLATASSKSEFVIVYEGPSSAICPRLRGSNARPRNTR